MNFVAIIVLMMPLSAFAKTTYTSSKTKVHMLELFSTQSCSSCPPAQEWVNGLKKSKYLWKTFIPVVFHVDYWNYLGWKDPFSSPIYTRRQKDYASELFQPTAYTPMFVLDGEVTRSHLAEKKLSLIGADVGILRVEKKADANHYQVMFQPSKRYAKPLVVYYSILGNGISTQIKAGENEGKNLEHDFLSLMLEKQPLKKTKSGYVANIKIDITELKIAPSRHIVFWVSEDVSMMPIQTVGGPL